MAARDSTSILATKVAVTGTTLFIAGGMASTSFQFIPALITAAQKAPSRPENASRAESGRLTPQPNISKQLGDGSTSSSNSGWFDGYKGAAQQFVSMSKTAFATQVPPELLSILASSYLAYHSYSKGTSNAGHKWAAVAAMIATVFPLTGGFMVPLDHKLARLGGDEEKLEPFEDAPPDRDAERRNTVEFLGKWDTLNRMRSAIMFAAGGLGLWGLVE
ncbi:hypothetical protein LTR37_014018 [Vermiconidia calcicola]|uniref:Uncharacterized protein n=1 Tax=Vermiconidia calcicola TaxID=1690605 RepID=A0ACC3MUV0_9PEZI|nr:hypothetical protein LTR37_014018 [Vermiconidia calcicola]